MKTYVKSYRAIGDDPTILVKWCRKNFGERGVGWDFTFMSRRVTIQIWEPRFITMYEMWQN
jgi:hypothetical protein